MYPCLHLDVLLILMVEILLIEKHRELGLDMEIALTSQSVSHPPHLANTILKHFGSKMQIKRKGQGLL